jgi:uncharacterized DUF497 family protein
MKFEYNTQKSLLNQKKHGIDFENAKLLWEDPERLEIPARQVDEPRYLIIGLINNIHWSAVVTYRNELIRLISVRRARKEEVKLYESI